MRLIPRLLAAADRLHAPLVAHAHCDLPCGVYDPAQARVEAQSVKAIMERYHQNQDPDYRTRCVAIKEERADLVKHHLWVLWTDYFKPEHLAKVPDLHDLFWRATKAAGDTKKTMDVAVADKLLGLIDDVDAAFKASKS